MSLSSFPLDLSLLVLRYLDHGDKIRMSSTCKAYRAQLVPDIFRTIRFTNDADIALSALAAVEAYGACTTRIEFTCESGPEDKSTAATLVPAASKLLNGSLTPNLHTISIKFVFDFNGEEGWDNNPYSQMDSSIYVFECVETEEYARKSEEKFIWRAVMNETWQAVSINEYARELIIDDLIPKWTSAFRTDEFRQFLSRIESATFNIFGMESGAGWQVNTVRGYVDFLSHLDEHFLHHMKKLKNLHIKASDPIGLEGRFHIPLALKASDLPALESLKLENCFVGRELSSFVQGHTQGLKTLDIKECISGGDGFGMAENSMYWAKFFDDIYIAKPMLTGLIVGDGLAPLTTEEEFNLPPDPAADHQLIQDIRQRMKTNPSMKVFGYGSLDDKYGMFFLDADLNVEEFLKGTDQRAYDRLMGLVHENNARAEYVPPYTA